MELEKSLHQSQEVLMQFCPYCSEIASLEVRELDIETREIVLEVGASFGTLPDYLHHEEVYNVLRPAPMNGFGGIG